MGVQIPKKYIEEAISKYTSDLKEKTKNISEKDPKKYSAFCQHVKKYSDEFQFSELLNFLS